MRFVLSRIIWLDLRGEEGFFRGVRGGSIGEQFVVATEKYLQIKPLGS